MQCEAVPSSLKTTAVDIGWSTAAVGRSWLTAEVDSGREFWQCELSDKRAFRIWSEVLEVHCETKTLKVYYCSF